MAIVHWTADATRDLEEIGYYIAIEDCRPSVAARILCEIQAKCELYATSPQIGFARPDLGIGCRVFRYKRWIVIYRQIETGIEILHVVDGSRDYDQLFAE
jgi:toxin ParE1/3/4